MAYHDSTGALLTIGRKLGEGGEGAVFATHEQPGLVAKIYAQPLPPGQLAKLEAMVHAGDASLRDVAAWPSAVLFEGTKPVGFTMPRAASRHALHELLGPKRRQTLFPNAHWQFLIHTAGNLARAFEVVHARGIVVGDVNSNNVVVHRNSTAQLIDCDSFQIRTERRVFRCNVGVAEYQPPELQGSDLSSVERTVQHDRFGLAVMIFQLLFVGKHPFAGILPLHVDGNGAIGANVAAKRFFYGREARRQGLRPPPGSIALAALTPQVAGLFNRAFLGAPHERPTAEAWRVALTELEGEIVACRANRLHRHLAGKGCPWCTLERRGLHYFTPPPNRARYAPLDESFWRSIAAGDIERAWAQVAAVAAPPALDTAQTTPRVRARPLRLWSRKRKQAYAAGAVAATAAITGIAVFAHPWVALAPGIAALFAWAGLAFRPDARAAFTQRERQCGTARRNYAAARERWLRAARGTAFAEKRRQLERLRADLLAQRARFDAELAQLRARHELAQLDAHLRKHTVRALRHPALDAEMRALLANHGVFTAADVTWERLPGPRMWGRINFLRDAMVGWRQHLEHEFIRAPRRPLDPKVVHDLGARHARERIDKFAALCAGEAALQALSAEIHRQRAALERQAAQMALEAAQAEADARISPVFYKTPLL